MLAGGDVGPLGTAAVTELHRVFDWAESSRKGSATRPSSLAFSLSLLSSFLYIFPLTSCTCHFLLLSLALGLPHAPSLCLSHAPSVLLFVDEADAFLRKRGDEGDGRMSEEMRNALSTFLYRTGSPTSKFMLVFATNEPSVRCSWRFASHHFAHFPVIFHFLSFDSIFIFANGHSTGF